MKRYHWILVGLIFFITLVNFVDRSAISFVIVPLKEEFHFSDTQFGMILSAFGLGYICLTVFGGWLVDRYGARRVWPLSAVGWSICVGFLGLAGGFWGFVMLRFLLGIAEGPHFPALSRSIGDWLPAQKRARALSLGLIAVPLSSVIGAPLCAYLVTDWGWRAMFFTLSAVGILWGVVWYCVFRDKPVAPQGQRAIDWRFILTHPVLIANNIAYFALGYMIFFATLWLPGYFLSQYGLDLKSVGWYLTLPWISGAIFLKVGGILSDWLYRKQMARSHVIWVGQLIAALFFVALSFSQTLEMAILFLSLGIGFGMLPQSVFFSANIDVVKERVGSAQGVSSGCFSLAGIIAPALTGYLVDLTGDYRGAFLLLAGLTLVAVVAVLCVRTDRS
jgi:MFS family permease